MAQPACPILLVEDDDDIVGAVSDLLTDEGYAVVHAGSGRAALDRLNAGLRPAAMLVDFGMPEMNGAEFMKICSADPALADIPALVMSAFRPADLAAAGLDGYLQKPFRPDDLVRQLAHMVNRAG
jgi:CheY-like chemotaxis protein